MSHRSKVGSVFTVHPTKNVPHAQRYGHAARPVTNFPSRTAIQEALNPAQASKLKKSKKGSRRRTASQLLSVAQRDAEAWDARVKSPFYSASSRPPSGPPSGGGAGSFGSGSHRKPPSGYRIPPLTKTEYETLIWLSEHGYDAGILKTAGVQDNLPDGGVILGMIPEHKAWEIRDAIDADPNAFLTSCGSAGLAEKLNRFVDSIM